jgi:hypothetical protein
MVHSRCAGRARPSPQAAAARRGRARPALLFSTRRSREYPRLRASLRNALPPADRRRRKGAARRGRLRQVPPALRGVVAAQRKDPHADRLARHGASERTLAQALGRAHRLPPTERPRRLARIGRGARLRARDLRCARHQLDHQDETRDALLRKRGRRARVLDRQRRIGRPARSRRSKNACSRPRPLRPQLLATMPIA